MTQFEKDLTLKQDIIDNFHKHELFKIEMVKFRKRNIATEIQFIHSQQKKLNDRLFELQNN